MIDKNYKHKIIDLGGLDVNEITDDAYILEIYNALKNNFGYPVEIKNFKINGSIHSNVINTPCIETDFITVNLGDYYLTVTQDNIEAQKGTYITGSLGVENDLDINGDFYANSANITNNTNTDNLTVANQTVTKNLEADTISDKNILISNSFYQGSVSHLTEHFLCIGEITLTAYYSSAYLLAVGNYIFSLGIGHNGTDYGFYNQTNVSSLYVASGNNFIGFKVVNGTLYIYIKIPTYYRCISYKVLSYRTEGQTYVNFYKTPVFDASITADDMDFTY